ncbi:MAG: hypothetical protein NTW19_09840 [Planctomycetota bacterium]|nr:hypothetical protein [Planctomycetota bacterium]
MTTTSQWIRFRLAAISLTMLLLACPPCRGEAILTPGELVKRVQETRAKYKTFDVSYSMDRHMWQDGGFPATPTATADIVWRQAGALGYTEESETVGLPGAGGHKTFTRWSSSPTVYKKYREENGGRSGIVSYDPTTLAGKQMNVAEVLWQPFHRDMWTGVIYDSNSTVEFDAKTNVYTLTSRVDDRGSMYILHIDASHGYLPVSGECRAGGSGKERRVMVYEATDLREVGNGLWLPYAWAWTSPALAKVNYRIHSAEVNSDVPVAKLDIVFPAGTRVRDDRFSIGLQILGWTMVAVVLLLTVVSLREWLRRS